MLPLRVARCWYMLFVKIGGLLMKQLPGIAFLAGLMLAFLSAAQGHAQGADVSCGGLKPVENALGYKVREANVRCEGLYVSTVRAISLELVGAMSGAPFDLNSGVVEIQGPALSDLPAALRRQINVRAVALPLKTYYRMDGLLDANSRLEWPVDEVVKRARLSPTDIALYGWLGTEFKPVFVPVRVATASARDQGYDAVRLLFRVSSDVESMYWRLTEGGVSTKWDKMVDGAVRSGRTVTVELPDGPSQQVQIDVNVKSPNSDDWSPHRFTVFRTMP